ncbi:hypothetical protein DPEC_G00209020 [Dallia pectoralis]|uniref:Uncharacterized protein n=1 Tax=Dallia pectoralis TaxID=75939 RepID=A0ACC2G4Z2_DALPE|nr:hypothetical protein DPEC_G00209020 [Dallia pectoralis]
MVAEHVILAKAISSRTRLGWLSTNFKVDIMHSGKLFPLLQSPACFTPLQPTIGTAHVYAGFGVAGPGPTGLGIAAIGVATTRTASTGTAGTRVAGTGTAGSGGTSSGGTDFGSGGGGQFFSTSSIEGSHQSSLN